MYCIQCCTTLDQVDLLLIKVELQIKIVNRAARLVKRSKAPWLEAPQVVYFDQPMGVLHRIRWSKYIIFIFSAFFILFCMHIFSLNKTGLQPVVQRVRAKPAYGCKAAFGSKVFLTLFSYFLS